MWSKSGPCPYLLVHPLSQVCRSTCQLWGSPESSKTFTFARALQLTSSLQSIFLQPNCGITEFGEVPSAGCTQIQFRPRPQARQLYFFVGGPICCLFNPLGSEKFAG